MRKLITAFSFLLLTNILFAQVPNYVPTSGIKAWYSFNNNANDASLNGNHLTNVGSVGFSTDRNGNANSSAYFDGSGQHFVKANPDIPSGSSDRTISFWYKEETNSETQPVLFSIDGNGTYPCQSTFTSYLNTSLAGYYLMGNCNDKSWGNSRQYNNWNHMVYVMKADTIYLYRNDTLLSNNFSYFHFSPSLNTIIAQFSIGDGYHAGGSSNPFKGAIDDFGIWDRALTRCEISSLNQAQNMPCRNTCIVAQYDFTGNANDVSGNANHGTVNGASLAIDRFGNSNSAYQFDGVNDWIELVSGTNTSLDIVGEYTINLWLKTNQTSYGPYLTFSDNLVNGGGILLNKLTLVDPNLLSVYSGSIWVAGNEVIDNDEWILLSVTSDISGLSIYHNGVLDAFYPGHPLTTSYNGNRRLGATSNFGSYFEGLMDDIKIFNCALSAAQIDSIYQSERSNPSACLMAQYDFSGNANDVSGYANHGTVNGATLIPDRFGNSNSAYQFDGVNDNIVSGFEPPSGNDSRTISFWAKTANGAIQVPIDYGNSVANNSFSVIFNSPCQGIGVDMSLGVVTSAANTTDNTWRHYTVVYDASFGAEINDVKFYQDGVLLPNASCGAANQNAAVNTTPGVGFTIGCNSPQTQRWFNGGIDDIKVFSCAFDGTQVDSIYQAERTNPQGCIVAQYDFNGNANDVSGYGNHGTVNGATLTTDRFGNANSAYQFDGLSNFIEVADNNSLDISNNYSFNLWVKIPDYSLNQNPSYPQRTMFCKPRNLGGGYSFRALEGYDWNSDGNAIPYASTWNTPTVNGGLESLTDSLPLNVWVNLAFTYDGSIAKLYKNGLLINSVNEIYSLVNSSEPLYIGKEFNFVDPTENRWFKGFLDDIKIFNCALSASQIDSIYQAEAPLQPCGIVVSGTPLPPFCHDGNNGTIDLTISGGQSPYSVFWNNNETTEDLSGLVPGNYTVIVTDDSGCDTMITYNVFNPVSMDINLNITNPSCGNNNGFATATVLNGGTGPFNYQWSSGDTLATADSLSAGIYMLTVTDPSGCTAAETFGVNNTGGLSLSAIVTDASCAGVFDGDINLIVSGGTSPYTYSWSNASTNEDLTNVKAGAYMVEVTDANGCVAVLNTSINANSIDLTNVNITDPSCGDTDGSITLNPTGGSAPYDYLWSSNAGSANTSSVSSLGAGTYFVTVTDNTGCEEIEMFSLSNSNGPSVSVNSISSADCGGTGGSINIGITSGISPFTYEWSNGETTQDISDLDLGSYSVDVTDGDGCVTSLNVNVPGVTLDPITLCMSTVNDVNGKVLCLWQKPAVDYISHFNIYRENSIAGQYDFWFSRPYDSTSQWTDQTANPQTRGWRYKVTYVDTCGNESPFGINHKTIHVTANLGVGNVVNLIWDHYEGFNFPTFYIERYHPSTGWETIDSIPSTLHSYTDNFPPNGNLQYAINIKSPSTCDPTRAGVNTSRSNVKNQPVASGLSVSETEEEISFELYPNPAQNELNISLLNFSGGELDLKLYNAIGELVMIKKLNSSNQKIDTREIPSGAYTISISNEKNSMIKKLMIVK